MAEMNAAWTAASEEIYKAQAAGAQPGPDPANGGAQPGPETSNSESKVEDVPFEEVK